MGERYTAADLLVASPFQWFADLDAGSDVTRDWVARCAAQPWIAAATAMDAQQRAA
jgi:glutathione S-transferase